MAWKYFQYLPLKKLKRRSTHLHCLAFLLDLCDLVTYEGLNLQENWIKDGL